MSLTRREFMHAAAGAAVLSAPILQRARAKDLDHLDQLTLWSSGESCLARESAAGYRRALAGLDHAPVIIVPAISTLSWQIAAALRTKVEVGHELVLESAFTFADENSAERQCQIVRGVFGLPVELNYPRAENAASYLQYRWPTEALVRSFGEPVYLAAGDHHPIGHDRDRRIIAAKKSIGRGQVTFLGSPLGPLLLAGDREAMLLIQRMVADPV